MSTHYQEILDSMNQKRPDLLFPLEWLDELDETERREVEKRIIKYCLLGVNVYFPYIPSLKCYPAEEIFTEDTMVSLEPFQKATIYKDLYKKTKNSIYLEKLLELAKMNFSVYSMLSFIYQENKTDEFYQKLREIMENSQDEKYRVVFQKRIQEVEDPSMKENDFTKMVQNGVYGFAVADALGVPVEFTNRVTRKVAPVKDMVGYGSHKVPEGTWSDDTSMTIATMDAMAKCNGVIDYDEIMKAYCRWAGKSEYTATGKLFDIGNTTRIALSSYLHNTPALQCGKKDEKSNGNGSLMRMLPIVYYVFEHNCSRDQIFELVGQYSSLTHGHDISKLGCQIYCDYMLSLLKGKNKEEALADLSQNDYADHYSPEVIRQYHRILNGSIKDIEKDDTISSSGYVVSTLEASLWSVLTTSSYEEAVLKAVNLGNDTDTVGAVTGSMAGTIYGKENIPERWLSMMRRMDYLDSICQNYSSKVHPTNKRVSERFSDIDGIRNFPKEDPTNPLDEMLKDEESPEDGVGSFIK